MTNRTKQKILATGFFYLLFMVLGTLGFLPSIFFDSHLGQTHSIFAPMSVLLEILLYVFVTFVLVTLIFDIIVDQVVKK